jgi:pimeloyl-ACP methyl ester carboxylesterase
LARAPEGALRLRTRAPEQRSDAQDSRAPVVIYFTGTGETPEAMLTAFQPLREQITALSHATEYVVEPPSNQGAYYGPHQFASRIWEGVSPLASHYAGPFILVGISRGALVALDVGARIVEEHAKVAGVLALSPPLMVPPKLPLPVLTLARFVEVVAGLQRQIATGPSWLAGLVEPVVRRAQIFLTAMVLKDLGVLAERELMLAVKAIEEYGALETGLRASREFRLLRETKAREMDLLTEGFVKTVTQTPGLFASLLWGSLDFWVHSAACAERMTALLERYPQARGRLHMARAEGQGHALFRAQGASQEPTLSCLRTVVDEALRRAAQSERSAQERASFEAEQARQIAEDALHD